VKSSILLDRQAAFVERATRMHNGRYDYSKVIYRGPRVHVDIVCPEHGVFSQTPQNHCRPRRNMDGYTGCRKCGKSDSLDVSKTYKKRLCPYCKAWVKHSRGARIPKCKNPDCVIQRGLDSGSSNGVEWIKALQDTARRLRNVSKRRMQSGWDKWARLRAITLYNRKPPTLTKNKRVIRDWDEWSGVTVSRVGRRVIDSQMSGWDRKVRQMQSALQKRGVTDGRKITKRALLDLLETQGYRCAITGDKLTPENCCADHIVPVARGGSYDISNIQLVTIEANRLKATMLMDEMIEVARKIVAHADSD
jgi:hypothetical protein